METLLRANTLRTHCPGAMAGTRAVRPVHDVLAGLGSPLEEVGQRPSDCVATDPCPVPNAAHQGKAGAETGLKRWEIDTCVKARRWRPCSLYDATGACAFCGGS